MYSTEQIHASQHKPRHTHTPHTTCKYTFHSVPKMLSLLAFLDNISMNNVRIYHPYYNSTCSMANFHDRLGTAAAES